MANSKRAILAATVLDLSVTQGSHTIYSAKRLNYNHLERTTHEVGPPNKSQGLVAPWLNWPGKACVSPGAVAGKAMTREVISEVNTSTMVGQDSPNSSSAFEPTSHP